MKKLYILFFSLLVGGLISTTNAQTSVDITFASDSTSFYCLPNAGIFWSVSMTTTGYITGDSVDVYVNFGDGVTEHERVAIWVSGSSQGAWANLQHYYTAPGTYTIKTLAIGPDGKKDSVISTTPVLIDVCGNLEGKLYVDNDNNCIFNSGDTELSNAMIVITDAITTDARYASTDINGNYSIQVPISGSYSVNLVTPLLTLACPSGGHTGITAPATGKDLGLQCGTGFDLFGNIFGQGFRPGFLRSFSAKAFNASCTPKSGTITVVLSDPRISYQPHSSVTNPPTVSGDSITWSFTNIDYNSITSSWNNSFPFHVMTDTAAIIGDSICMEVIVKPSTGDNDAANNHITLCFPIRNSFDPNEKAAQPLGIGEDHIIPPQSNIDYTIFFQNTGNDVAYDVFILDTLDESTLDISTLQITGASHAMDWVIYEDNIVRFNFNGINLPDSNANEPESHGYVTFSIKVKNVALGTEVKNGAAIYFDFNDPIITNVVSRKVDIVDGISTLSDREETVFIYPNPTKGEITVQLNESGISRLTVRNMVGQEIESYQLKEGANKLNLSGMLPGMYLMEIITENDRQVKRVIVQ